MGTSARGVVSPALATLDPLNLLLIMKKSMRFTVFFSVLAVTSASYAKIVSYEPGSDVTQHSRIDLDQADLESYVKAPYDWTNANAMYSNGGHSGAKVTLTLAAPLASAAAKGALVTQGAASGAIKSAAAIGATSITVAVSSACVQGASKTPDVTGCFTISGGAINLAGTTIGISTAASYSYRSIKGFSTAAKAKMLGQRYYQAYRAYWGVDDYANQFVSAALTGTAVTNYDFTGKSDVYRQECAKKGSVYWNVWMYVIREMEDALDDCNQGCLNCNDDPVHAWDEAVAFYAGSLEGTDGSGSGKLLHALADKRCSNYGTCTGDSDNDKKAGNSEVNKLILAQFNLGQAKLLAGKCVEVQAIKDRIVQLMSVPLVQGALRYAYKVDLLSGADKEKAEMVAFTGAILPRVAVCSAKSAATIRSNMFIGGTVTAGFAAVKTAFEENYACMGFTCGDVGGLMLNDGYYAGFSPCVDASTPSSSGSSDGDDKNWAVPVVVVLSVVVVALLGVSIGLYVGKQPANQPAGLLQATPVNAVPMDDTQQTGASVHSGTNKVEMDTDPAGQMEPTEDTAAQADSVPTTERGCGMC